MATDSIAALRMIPHRKPLGAAYVCLLLFMVVACARPGDWIPGVAYLRPAAITGGLAIVALLFALGSNRQRLPREVIYLILLFVQLWMTVPMSPVWRGGAFNTTLDFTKVLPIIIVMALVVNTIKKLRWLILVQTASVVTVAVATIWKGHQLGGRLAGALNGIYSNSNDLAFVIAISVPLCLYLLFRSRSKLGKAIWALAILVMVYTVFLTASRGGLIALAAAAAICLWEFAVRGRRRYLLVVAVVTGIVFWVYTGKGVRSRFEATTQTTNAEQASAYDSAQQRWNLLIQSLKVTAQHPLFGVGPGNFEVVSGYWRVTHNSYTQMSSEGGVLAFVLYIMILWRGLANLAATKRLSRSAEERRMLASALRASLVAFVFGSFFASVAYLFYPYFFVAYTTALYTISAREAIEKRSRDKAEANGRKAQETQNELPGTEAVWSGN
jgi:O-antigen ligase